MIVRRASAAFAWALVLAAAGAVQAQSPPAYSVMPILFVPDPASFPPGYQPTPQQLAEDLANITEAMRRTQVWYTQALGLSTTGLRIWPAVRMDALHGLDYYGITWTTPMRRYLDGITIESYFWSWVNGEISSRGYGPGTSSAPRMTVTFCKGAGGFAGGAQWHWSSGGGMCILGDWCLDSLANRVPPADWSWWTGKDKQTSATGHEMGHTIGMPHPDTVNPVTGVEDWAYTMMGWWWDWPTYPVNPADPTWPLRGLHAWANNAGPSGSTPAYMDVFLLTYRTAWFASPLPDADADGVPDYLDQCPDTPPGMDVDDRGCPITAVADFDLDRDVDLDDFAHLQACYTTTEQVRPASGCENADLDHDDEVDEQDLVVLLHCLSGADVPADLACGT